MFVKHLIIIIIIIIIIIKAGQRRREVLQGTRARMARKARGHVGHAI